MADQTSINLRIDPVTLKRLEALARRLALSRASIVRLAVAKLAQAEGVDGDRE